MAKRYQSPEGWWYNLLTGNNPPLPGRQLRHLLRLLPSGPRCKFCNAPYRGFGGQVMQLMGKGPSRLTPQLCRQCQDFANQYLGGTEIELTMLFADVRGSTPLAEKMGPTEFSKLISRFFGIAGEILIRHLAMVDRLAGDQATVLFVPGFAGLDHREHAIKAAEELLEATGHNQSNGPWIPMGIGIHTGVAFVGSVGSEGTATHITVVGDPANAAARLSSTAKAGEILISRDAATPELDEEHLETRELELKGKSQKVRVCVLKRSSQEHW